ncbi:hypothetical protein SORBI_3004G322500 [Sorghum bicolor]|uniref:Uncharacterized protein n=1 Tax=Sorghum bicolor TaxID=4558 RepID=A0A194YSM0_SORBI|nr:hypothetical protein SORBI_3004G322500 [Sorghum bicolor]
MVTMPPGLRIIAASVAQFGSLADFAVGASPLAHFGCSWTREVVRAEGMVPDAVPFPVLFLIPPGTGEFRWDRQSDGERQHQWRTGGAVLTFTGRCGGTGRASSSEDAASRSSSRKSQLEGIVTCHPAVHWSIFRCSHRKSKPSPSSFFFFFFFFFEESLSSSWTAGLDLG